MLADGTLRKLEMHLTSLHLGEGLLTWTRKDTIAFLEEKGPTGSGKKVTDSRSNSCKKTALQRYVLACVTAHTWAQSVDQETMHDLKLLFNAIPCSTRSEVSAPHLLIGHVDDAEWCEAFVSLQQLYEPFARGHLTLVGYQLLDGLAAVRHHEGCKQHFQAQAAELKAKGIAIRLDNRYVHTREHISIHMLGTHVHGTCVHIDFYQLNRPEYGVVWIYPVYAWPYNMPHTTLFHTCLPHSLIFDGHAENIL